MTEVMQQLEAAGEPTKKSTLSMWFSVKEDNFIRPKAELLPLLLKQFLPEADTGQFQETLDELNSYFLYSKGPMSSEALRNHISKQLDDTLISTLKRNQQALSIYTEALEELLEAIEPKVLEYDKGYPVIRIEGEDLKLLRSLLGKERSVHKAYQVEDGYEIPLTKIQSFEALTEILNHLNEGSRVLRGFVERDILENAYLGDQLPRIEDFVSYCWEISDRLLHNNLLCKNVPVLRRTLLRVMATCWGIRYLLKNQTGQVSEIQFQNILKLKGKENEADINCSVAVYMGILARQFIRQGSRERVQQGTKLYTKARELLLKYHAQLHTEQEIFFYKKEIANLSYDMGSFLLWHQSQNPRYRSLSQDAMQEAAQYFSQVLETVNLFYQGLTEPRAQHVRGFYVLSLCWTLVPPKKAVGEINKISAGQNFNQQFWFTQIVKAIAYGTLWYRSENESEKTEFFKAAESHLQKALLVPGFNEQTQQECEQDYILSQAFPDFAFSLH